MRFASPWMFLLLPLIPAALYWAVRRNRCAAAPFPASKPLKLAGGSWRTAMAPVPWVLRAGALTLVVIALARPQLGSERVRDLSRGIAIEMVVDRSSSMGADMRYRGRNVTRLEAVKRVFTDFVDGAGDLPGRPNDLLGMITFARYPDTVCPLTLSHETLTGLIDSVDLVQARPEDGTAIGDALSLAAARLRTAEQALARKTGERQDYEIKSKIIIILTDGENNAGQRSVEQAAKLCAEWGIKVYAIGVGQDRNISTAFGVVTVPKTPGVDDEALRRLAETTGGVYRLANDATSLVEIYQEIDELEKSEIQAVRYLDYQELFAPFALTGLLLVGLESLLAGTVLRRTP